MGGFLKSLQIPTNGTAGPTWEQICSPPNNIDNNFHYCPSTGSSSQRNLSKPKICRRLDDLLRANDGYQMIQQNGQRIFEPSPSANVFPPPRGSEIYIGNIPKHVYEDQLVPLFQQVGKLYQFRLMLDFNQRTRGYGFASYFNSQDVSAAIKRFDGYEIIRGTSLAVFKSIDNRRIFVGNIPKEKTREDVYFFFTRYFEGVVNVIMYSSWQNKDLNRGFAFVEFNSHALASLARRQLHPRNLIIWDQCLYVDWAQPLPDVDSSIMTRVSVLYAKNLPYNMDNVEVHSLFQSIAGESRIRRTHKILTYAFVHCKNRRSAEIAMDKLTGLVLEGQVIEIEWARPRQFSAQKRAMAPPENFCLSVPIRTRKLVREMTKFMKPSTRAGSETESPQLSICSAEQGTSSDQSFYSY